MRTAQKVDEKGAKRDEGGVNDRLPAATKKVIVRFQWMAKWAARTRFDWGKC